MTTNYPLLDFVIGFILGYATIWYVNSIYKELRKILKKKYYTLYIFDERNEKFEKVSTYKERSMRNAITEHFLSYGGNAELTHFRTITDYNDNTMRYFLTINGDHCFFAMLRESDGAKIEQR